MRFTGKKLRVILLFSLLLASAVLSTIPVAKAWTTTVDAYNNSEATATTVQIAYDGVYNGTTTPCSFTDTLTHFVLCNATDSYGSEFQGWMFNGYMYLDLAFFLNDVTSGKTVTAIYENEPGVENGTGGVGNYTFYGPMLELSGEDLGSVDVTSFFSEAGTIAEKFNCTGQFGYNTTVQPLYFQYDLGTYKREYWLEPGENDIDLYVVNGTLAQYTINFLDTANILKDYPFVSAKSYINGSLVTVEKRKVDQVGNVVFNLVSGNKYSFVLSSGSSDVTFGDVTVSSTASIQLVLKALNFPKDTLLTYQYTHIYSSRNFTTDTIDVVYEDLAAGTTSVNILIYDGTTLEYNSTQYADVFTDSWSSPLDNTSYTVRTTITHESYGTMHFNQYLPGVLDTSAPWSLAFLGDIGNVETAYLLPAGIVLFAAACFSVLSLEAGIIATLAVATILRMLNWLPIPTGLLVAAWAVGILGVISLSRRRINE